MIAETKETKPPRSRNFVCVFYPEDPKHVWLLNQMITKYDRIFRAVYILHDKDTYLQSDYDAYVQNEGKQPEWHVGDLKKAHYHVLLQYSSQRLVTGVSESLAGVHVEICSNVDAQLLYFIHGDYNSRDKYQYPISDMQGDRRTIQRLVRQNAHFVQLGNIADQIETGATLAQIIKQAPLSDDLSVETIERYQTLVIAMSNQFDRRNRFAASLDDSTVRAMRASIVQEVYDALAPKYNQ